MKQFNDSVVYVRNGKPLPAIVLASQASEQGELLTLLYADPANGPQLLAQGTTRGIAQVQQAVAPMAEGKVFGWKDLEFYPEDQAAHDALSKAHDVANEELKKVTENARAVDKENITLKAEIDKLTEQPNPLQVELNTAREESASLREEILKVTAMLNQKPEPAPWQPPAPLKDWSPTPESVAFAAQGVPTQDIQKFTVDLTPESPHAIEPIMPTDPTSLESVEAAKAAALAAENEKLAAEHGIDLNNLPPVPEAPADAPAGPEQPHAIPGGIESDAPPYEVKTYSDGTVASGPGPMPDLSPAQQDAAEKASL